ncbi:hypothetical protein SAMN05428945_5042 [Streptomyces sp. 2224.1]|nr:hypothetical protein BX261_0290 [Streptomyces sp. 2321.6]SDR58490.1 hypothetical protein SAMN05216511_6930 [Streptomyces sp. KS_16]SEB75762.1 hypothetical protein SAMN05428940_0292 [Streptomyces sp. 2133.1]SED48650.1 hypothetical protein SAMN05428945_5042 [Streptomyces sp. 2224.1]SNC60571.1 hypothetical protein SAMN06272741_0292 [Streptomyces sp. 2114.4]
MQLTGETLERAMAVLGGQTTYPAAPSASDAEPDPAGSAEDGETDRDDEGAAHNGDGEGRAVPETARRTPPKRNHLRGL